MARKNAKTIKPKRPVGRPRKAPPKVVPHEIEDTLDNDLSDSLDVLEPLPQEVLDNLPERTLRKQAPRSSGKHPNTNAKGTPYLKHTRFDVTKQRQFLKELAIHGNTSTAAASVGVVRQTPYQLMKRDPKFAARVEIAKQKSLGKLENELYKRIFEGSKVTVYNAEGDIITQTVKDDSSLLIKALESGDRERYGKTAGGGVTVNVDTGASVANKLSQLLGLEVTKEDFDAEYKDITPEEA